MTLISDNHIIIDTSYIISMVKGTYTDGYGKDYQTLEMQLTVGTVSRIQYANVDERDLMYNKIVKEMISAQNS
jgi:hypothetical protein